MQRQGQTTLYEAPSSWLQLNTYAFIRCHSGGDATATDLATDFHISSLAPLSFYASEGAS